MAHIEDVLLYSLTQKGDRYIFGTEVPLKASDSAAWDCSELVEWSCGKAGVKPTVPDGAYYQWRHCKDRGMSIPVSRGREVRGALLFVGDGTGVGRDAVTHVAWSLGDGTTIEARGRRWGVGSWPTASRFDFAALVPGVDYSPRKPLPPPQEDDMADYAEQLNRIERRMEDIAKGVTQAVAAIAELDEDLPENVKEKLEEIQRNLRRDMQADGVPADQIEK